MAPDLIEEEEEEELEKSSNVKTTLESTHRLSEKKKTKRRVESGEFGSLLRCQDIFSSSHSHYCSDREREREREDQNERRLKTLSVVHYLSRRRRRPNSTPAIIKSERYSLGQQI